MNKSFLASSAVIIAAAVAGYWIVAEPGPDACRKCRSHAPSVNEASATAETPTTSPARKTDEFIVLTHFYEPTGDELELQNLLESIATEYLPPPREVTNGWNWLGEAGEEQSSPADGLTILLRHAYRLAAFRCAELVARIEPLIGAEQTWGTTSETE